MCNIVDPTPDVLPTPVVLDACVLFPGSPRDVFLRIADAGVYKLHLTEQILEEMRRNLVEKRQVTGEKGQGIVRWITETFPKSFVPGYTHLVPKMPVNEKDRHVLAAAVASKSKIIVTQNLKDFPQLLLAPMGIEVLPIDDFLVRLLKEEKVKMLDVMRGYVNSFKNPPLTVQEALDKLKKHAPNFVQLILNELIG